MNNLGQRAYARLINVSGVKSITFHGLRHTCATLALKAGVPVKVVSERLGHKRIEVTLGDITVSGIISPYFLGHPRQFLALKSFLTPLLSLFGLGGMAADERFLANGQHFRDELNE